MEKYSKTLSQFLEEKLQIFRQIEANLSLMSFYLVKPTQEIPNSKFLRNFAQVFSFDANRGGFDLVVSVKRSEDHCGP